MSQNRLPGIANPQNTKRLGHFLTTDYKSVERLTEKSTLTANKPVPADLKSAVKKGSTYENWGICNPPITNEPKPITGDCKSPEHKRG